MVTWLVLLGVALLVAVVGGLVYAVLQIAHVAAQAEAVHAALTRAPEGPPPEVVPEPDAIPAPRDLVTLRFVSADGALLGQARIRRGHRRPTITWQAQQFVASHHEGHTFIYRRVGADRSHG